MRNDELNSGATRASSESSDALYVAGDAAPPLPTDESSAQEENFKTSEFAVSSPELIEDLRRVQVFADLPEDQLTWFIEHSYELRLAPGDVLFRKGAPPEWMVVYLEGEMQARRDDRGRETDTSTSLAPVMQRRK